MDRLLPQTAYCNCYGHRLNISPLSYETFYKFSNSAVGGKKPFLHISHTIIHVIHILFENMPIATPSPPFPLFPPFPPPTILLMYREPNGIFVIVACARLININTISL